MAIPVGYRSAWNFQFFENFNIFKKLKISSAPIANRNSRNDSLWKHFFHPKVSQYFELLHEIGFMQKKQFLAILQL